MKYFAAALSVLFTSSFFIGWLSPQSAEEFHWKLVSDWAPLFYIAVLAVLDYLLYKTTLRVISWGNSRINSNKDCIK